MTLAAGSHCGRSVDDAYSLQQQQQQLGALPQHPHHHLRILRAASPSALATVNTKSLGRRMYQTPPRSVTALSCLICAEVSNPCRVLLGHFELRIWHRGVGLDMNWLTTGNMGPGGVWCVRLIDWLTDLRFYFYSWHKVGHTFLGPFYGAIVVPSVTRCRCCCRCCRCGHRFYIAIHQVSLKAACGSSQCEWAQHFSNASCFINSITAIPTTLVDG